MANAFIFAGANASGKSTYITHLLQNKIIWGEYISPDLILKEQLKLDGTIENYKKAFEIGEQQRHVAVLSQKDIIMETVFSTQEKIDFIHKLQDNNYHITLFFTGTQSPEYNAVYLLSRVERGGHDVPLTKLLARRTRGTENIKKVARDVDCFFLVDNSSFGEAPLIIKSFQKGSCCFINPLLERDVTWHQEIVDTLHDELSVAGVATPEHLAFCEAIQDSVSHFEIISDFNEQNKILLKYSS